MRYTPKAMPALANRARFNSYLTWTIKAYRAGLWTADDRALWHVVMGWGEHHGVPLPAHPSKYRAPFSFDPSYCRYAIGFEILLAHTLAARAGGNWSLGGEELWDQIIQWGWLVGVSLPEKVEDYR